MPIVAPPIQKPAIDRDCAAVHGSGGAAPRRLL